MFETNEYDIAEFDCDAFETECPVWRLVGMPRNVYELESLGNNYNDCQD